MDLKTFEEKLWIESVETSKQINEFQEDMISIQEQFENTRPEQVYLIDSFPAPIRYPASEVLEIYYDHKQKGPIKDGYYLQQEERFIEVMKRLWAISPVFIQADLHTRLDFIKVPIEELKKNLTGHKANLLNRIIKETKQHQDNLFAFEQFEEINLIARMSLREKISSCFVFPDIRVIIWTNSLAFKIYIYEKSNKDLIQTICTTHGLYLRK